MVIYSPNDYLVYDDGEDDFSEYHECCINIGVD